MDPGPLPPHERAWRHPSELAPAPHEPTTTTGRVLIVTSATVSLLLIGILAVAITPGRSAAPTATDATPTGGAARGVTVTLAAITTVLPRPVTTGVTPQTTLTRVSLPVITPLGDEGLAVTTLDAVTGHDGRVTARLPGGEVVDVDVVAVSRADGLAVVALPDTHRPPGMTLAVAAPRPTDTVFVHSEDPVVVALAELAEMDVDEGTPVTDGRGELVGLCTDDDEDEGTALRTVATVPTSATVAAAVSGPATGATSPPSTRPASTPPSSTRPPTTPPVTPTTAPPGNGATPAPTVATPPPTVTTAPPAPAAPPAPRSPGPTSAPTTAPTSAPTTVTTSTSTAGAPTTAPSRPALSGGGASGAPG